MPSSAEMIIMTSLKYSRVRCPLEVERVGRQPQTWPVGHTDMGHVSVPPSPLLPHSPQYNVHFLKLNIIFESPNFGPSFNTDLSFLWCVASSCQMYSFKKY